jgi:Uncharacterized protein, homolog of phage Mu protein gp30
MTQPQTVEPPPPEEVQGAENEFTALVLAALTVWLALVFPAVMASVVPNPAAIWQFQPVWVREVDKLMPYLERLARRGWQQTMRQFGMDLPFQADPLLLDQLARTRNLLVRIPDETYQQLIKSLATGVDAGQSRAQLEQRIRNILTITGSENWPARAATIGRTEVNRFFNAGALAAAQRVQADTGRRIVKRWRDENDNRVRPAHARVDGKFRPLGEPFEVGGSLLQYPGDPSGLPSTVINCRCDLVFKEAS